MSELFRLEAVSYQQQKMYGNILLDSSWSDQALTIFFCALIGLILLFSFLFGFAHQETARGMLVRSSDVDRQDPASTTLPDETLTATLTAPPAVPLVSPVLHPPLYAELYVPSHAIGLLKPGLPLMLRYDAFPYQKFGRFRGVIDTIAETMTDLDGEPIVSATKPSTEAVYRVRVVLDQQQIHWQGDDYPLRPGMQLEASLVLEYRRLYQWMLASLMNQSGNQSSARTGRIDVTRDMTPKEPG